METTGERICRLRGRQSMTQQALGKLCGVSRRAVCDWEADRCRPRTSRLITLAQALQTTESYIKDGDVGLYRTALGKLMEQLDERLSGSGADSKPNARSHSRGDRRDKSA